MGKRFLDPVSILVMSTNRRRKHPRRVCTKPQMHLSCSRLLRSVVICMEEPWHQHNLNRSFFGSKFVIPVRLCDQNNFEAWTSYMWSRQPTNCLKKSFKLWLLKGLSLLQCLHGQYSYPISIPESTPSSFARGRVSQVCRASNTCAAILQ